MAEHIDRARLQYDLRYRFDYLSKFLQFNRDEIQILNNFAPKIFPFIPSIVHKVYQKLYSFDITKDHFLRRNDDFTSISSGTDETDASCLSLQTEFRCDMLSIYLKRLFLQTEWNDSFLQYLAQVGELHTNKDAFFTVNVSYIHMNCLLSYLEHLFMETILNINELDYQKKWQMVRIINHVFWIQNDLFTMQYGISKQENFSLKVSSNKSKKCCF